MVQLLMLARAIARPIIVHSSLFAAASVAPRVALPRPFATAAATKSKASTKAKKPKAAVSKTTKRSVSTKVKPKKTPQPKLKPWQARGPDGKLIPLPSSTKPTLRSSFFIYMSDRIPLLKSQSTFHKTSPKSGNQVVDIMKLSKHIGEEWNALSASEKEKYFEIHKKEKAEYQKALAQWHAQLTLEDIKRQNAYTANQRKKGIKGVALLRDPAKPKRPNSAFFEFLSDLRKQDSATGSPSSITELSRRGGELWKQMSADKKVPYEQKATDALEQYKKDFEDYNRAREAAL